jgi:putative adenylate-forming enzyme
MIAARLTTLAAFAHARWLTHRLRTRADIDRWRTRRLAHFLQHIAPRVAAFRDLAGAPLDRFPYMDKAALMAAFERYNTLGLTAARGWSALDKGTPPRGYAVGASTGTSGNRGLYVVSDAERYRWLGIMLAKALPETLHTRQRLALMLPTSSRLYDAANESQRLQLRFFDLKDGVEAQIPALEAFNPTIIIAPPHALRFLAESDTNLTPKHIFSGAEVLDATDRAIVEARYGRRVREIYMATEGLFAIACAHGTLHLLEDYVAFEWEREGALSAPIVTDFTRRTQMMVRYRMNDLLELSDEPCACGSPLQPVRAVHGRADDAFHIAGALITPDVIRNAIIDSDRGIDDFRATQTGPSEIKITLAPGPTTRIDAVKANLAAALARLGASAIIDVAFEPLAPPQGRKLRRVQRLITPARIS